MKLIGFDSARLPKSSVMGSISIQESIQVKFQFSNLTDIIGFLNEGSIAKMGRMDELWKSTCFEFFIGEKDQNNYFEFNFALSGYWNSYSFSNYREGMARSDMQLVSAALELSSPTEATLTLEVDLPGKLKQKSADQFEVSITSILAYHKGGQNFFAFSHPKEKPDFHDRRHWLSYSPQLENL